MIYTIFKEKKIKKKFFFIENEKHFSEKKSE